MTETKKIYDGLPETVRIGYKDCRIEIWGGSGVLANKRFGEFSGAESVIRIASGLCPKEAANTILHEILHGVFMCFNVPTGDDEKHKLVEEYAVTGVANGLCCVMRDNPQLFDWIRRCLA